MKKAVHEAEVKRWLRPLAGEPETDPRIDVAETMRRGARLRRQRRIANGAAYATVLAVTIAGGLVMLPVLGNRDRTAEPASSASASTGPSEWAYGPLPSSGAPPAPEGLPCPLGEFPMPGAQLYRTDRTGRWSATGRSYPSDEHTPSILRDGVPTGSVTVPDGSAVVVTALNSSGHAAVTSIGEQSMPWVYADGTLTPLPGGPGAARGINDSGRIAGTLEDGARPVLWSGPGADPLDLPMPDGFAWAGVTGIGNDGTVAAAVGPDSESREALALWLPDGSTRVVRAPGAGEILIPESMADGWVIGRDSTGRGFRYDIAAARYEMLPGQLAAPVAVTAEGVVAGLASMNQDSDYGRMPYVLLGDGVRPLAQPDDTAHFHISGIAGDGGTVFGTIETTDGTYRAVTWSCS